MNGNMSSQCYFMNMNSIGAAPSNSEMKPLIKEKVMSYEEKTVGSTPFFKCEACPYMALAEDDIKFHLFTIHPDLARTNGLADNIQIPCPGCTSVFNAEETLRNHLRNHHKMGIKDVKKMVKSLVQIALKDAKLRREFIPNSTPPPAPFRQDINEVKIPQVIEIVPDIVNANTDPLPKGVAFISVDELNKMSTPNFEQVDPKEIIQEASINIVYANEVSTQYVNVSNAGTLSSNVSMLQMSSVAPDLISSIQPHIAAIIDNTNLSPQQVENSESMPKVGIPMTPKLYSTELQSSEVEYRTCSVDDCRLRLKDEEKMKYHRKCHKNGKLHCLECKGVFGTTEGLHVHLWKDHKIDLELWTCEICNYKTYKKYRLYSLHMKCHGTNRDFFCTTCSKGFKNSNQLAKHNMLHKPKQFVTCPTCNLELSSPQRLKSHIQAVHDNYKPFTCVECNYSFARKAELKLHVRSHTGDKPYSCDQCSYRSADHNAMRRHKKTHFSEGLYACKYCPYTTIQSTTFTSHMISKHPNITSNDIHRCPYCTYKTINKKKYVTHLTKHADKEGVQLLMEISTGVKNKPSWTIPSETDKHSKEDKVSEQDKGSDATDNPIDVEEYDCDSISESLPQDYSKNYSTPPNNLPDTNFDNQIMVQDLSKDDNNSDCLISESSNDTSMDRHQYTPQLPLEMSYESPQSNLHEFLNISVSMEQNLLQNNNVNSLVTSHSAVDNNISNNIMSNFPIRLPPVPQISVRNNITLKPVDKISLPLTTKVTGPIITPTQILPVPSSNISTPVNLSNDPEGAPRKKPKISVKSNLILKGPDQVNMFHSQQKMAFKQLEDSERFGLGGPVTFNNLITTQFMQMQPKASMDESPSNLIPFPQETIMGDAESTPVGNKINDNSQIFTFNQQMNVNQMTMLPPPQKIQTTDPSYIKLEATIKQNTQSPSLERMCNANLLSNQVINHEYKASPPLEDIHKNLSEIKNEVKSDTYYNISLPNNTANPPIIDQYLIDNIIGEQYIGHLDLSGVALPEASDDQQNDVIEIDDNSDDNKLLPRFDMNFPLESLYLMHNDFHFLENDVPPSNLSNEVNEMNRMVAEVPIINQNTEVMDNSSNEIANFIQGKIDPMMNTSVRPTTKINVKNIELMKN